MKQVTPRKRRRLTVISRQRDWRTERFAEVLAAYVLARLASPDDEPRRPDEEASA